MNVINKVKILLLYLLYLPRFYRPIWKYVFNYKSYKNFKSNKFILNDLQKRAIHELNVYGISKVNYSELFSEKELKQLLKEAESIVDRNKHILNKRREDISRDLPIDTTKPYLLSLADEGILDLQSIFVKFSLSDKILGIVNTYLGLSANLVQGDLWYNLKMLENKRVASQRWHKDPTDLKFIKIFLYLRDVGIGDGPFQFIPKTHDDGENGNIFRRFLPFGVYPDSDKVEKKFHGEELSMTGKAGTIIFCNSSGLHRGGFAIDNDRYLYMSYFLTDGAYGLKKLVKKLIYKTKSADESKMSKHSRYAIRLHST